MIRLPLEYVDAEVDKLYDKSFDLSEVEAVNKHCDFIIAFINACGYTEEEYIRHVMGFEPEEVLN